MAEFSSHVPGTFSWAELATTDQKAGVAFYRALFGWDVNEAPIGPDEVYSMFTMRGKEVAAGYTMRPEERQTGAPPHWNLYVTVANVDESVKKAEALGAKVFAPPFDVMDVGRMAILQDPTGAVFEVWQAKLHIGAKILNEPGALCWSELTTRDPKKAEAFYTALFGWTRETRRARFADGIHRVQQSGKTRRRHDGDAEADAPAGAVLLDAVFPGRRLRRQRREGERPGRQSDDGAAGHSRHRAGSRS